MGTMSDSKPNPEDPAGSPVLNKAHLEATNSQLSNVSQVVNSPGSVVNQTNVTEVQSGTNSAAILLGGLALLTAQAFLPIGRSYGGVDVFVAGVALAMIVAGFFSWVECLLKPAVRFEIAGWLIGVRVGQKLEPWPKTFAKVFDRVFGQEHFSWKCFLRSCVASNAVAMLSLLFTLFHPNVIFPNDKNVPRIMPLHSDYWPLLASVIVTNALPDYLSLLETRGVIRRLNRDGMKDMRWLLFEDMFITFALCVCATYIGGSLLETSQFSGAANVLDAAHANFVTLWMIPAFFTSIWLWLYVTSGFLLKAARRFDTGFQWFNRKFDIEKRPLQAIGLVSGAIVAVLYWGVASLAYLLR
jgi:hypothetical protein